MTTTIEKPVPIENVRSDDLCFETDHDLQLRYTGGSDGAVLVVLNCDGERYDNVSTEGQYDAATQIEKGIEALQETLAVLRRLRD